MRTSVKEQMKLGYVIDKVVDNRGKTPQWGNEGFELIETTSIVGKNKHPDFSLISKRISKETFETWFRAGHPIKGDILIATVGANIGNISIMKETRGCIAQNLVALRTNENLIDADFLYYFLSWDKTQRQLRNLDIGAAQPSIKVPHLLDFEIPVPHLSTQRKIAAILSAYDDLIENNTRRIQILQKIAWGLYEEWFVRFRFPGHENVKMVESELGLIPKGWEVATLEDIVSNIRNSTKAGAHLSDRQYVPIECISRDSLALTEFFSWEEAQSSLILFEERDILFGAMRPYFHKVTIAPFRGVTRTTCFVLRPKSDFLHSFAVTTLFSKSTVNFASANSKGATIPYAVWDGVMANMRIVLPPKFLLGKFDEIVSPMLEAIRKSTFKQHNLQQTRDLLIPKLISGEIDVSNFPEPVSD